MRDGETVPPRDRFVRADTYRAEREWLRYEGTAQRDLFRELRERFLTRHAEDAPWVLDAGSGPGRFTARVGGPRSNRVAIDLSRAMLLAARERARTERSDADDHGFEVAGDLLGPPFLRAAFGEVALLGNTLGFAGEDGVALLAEVESLVGPSGILLLEVAPGHGERSRYLARLPPSAVGRLFEAPLAWVERRVLAEGFAREPRRHREHEFRRWGPDEIHERYRRLGWTVEETLAVAPALGPDAPRVEAVAGRPSARARLLELEERFGRSPARWPEAAALLVAVRRP